MLTQTAPSTWPCSVAGERLPTWGPSFPSLPPRRHRAAVERRAHHHLSAVHSSTSSFSAFKSHMSTAGSSCSLGSGAAAATPWPRPSAAFIRMLRSLRQAPMTSKAASDAKGGSDCNVNSNKGDISATLSPSQQQGQHAADGNVPNTLALSREKSDGPSTCLRVTDVVKALPGETPTAVASGDFAAVTTAEGASHANTAQSEYVEEYETVYETESEEHASSSSRLLPGTIAVGSKAEAARETEGATLGVGSTVAEAEAAGAPAAFRGLHTAAARYQSATALQATSPPLALLPLGGHAGVAASLGGTTAGGWAVAAALLLAIRMSRQEADAERLDLQALQALQAEGRQRDSELRARRKAFLEQERRKLEDEAARRVAEAKARQEEEARAAAERQRQWQEEAAREAQRMQEAAAAARRVYEEREARLAEELAARAEVERRLREEAEVKRREEAETRRRAEVEAAQRAADQRAAAAAAEAARQAAEDAARREAERRLKLASTWYTLAFRGRVAARPAAPGSTVPLNLSSPGGTAAAMLRGPPAARIVLDCTFELSHVSRTAPTLTTALDGVATQDAAGVAAAVEAAGADGAAAAATKAVPAVEFPAYGDSGVGIGVGMAAAAPAAAAASGKPYESAAAAVEGAAELAGAAAAPLGALISSTSWLGALPLEPSPREALVRWIAGGAVGGEEQEGRAAAAAATAPPVGDPASFSGTSEAATAATAAVDVEFLVDAELRHWGRMAHLQLLSSGRQIICQLAPLLGPGEQLEQELQCRISRQVPPPALPLAVTAAATAAASAAPAAASAAPAVTPHAVAPSLRRAAAAVAAGQLQRAVDIINGVVSGEEAAAAAGRDGAANGAALPPLAVAALVYGELMESAGYEVAAAEAPESSATTAPIRNSTEGAVSSESAGEKAGDVPEATMAAVAGGSLERLARYQLSERAKKAPLDSLTVTAQFLRAVLPGGPRHPVVRILDKLAEANMSLATRQAMQIRQQRAALEAQAAAVLEQQRDGGSPGSREGTGGALLVGPGGAADARGSLVPVPERLWATRNVANNLMRFGEPLQVGEAVNMLEESVSMARRHYGERHPCQLAVLLDYLDALAAEAAIQAKVAAAVQQAPDGLDRQQQPQPRTQSGMEAGGSSRQYRAAEELLEVVQALCERYQASRDPLSCVLLLEAALVMVTPVLRPTGRGAGGGRSSSGRGPASLAAASELAGELMYSLKPPEARTVMTIRREGQLPSLMRRLARDFTEELAAYGKKRNRWVDAFNKGGPLPPLRP